MNRCPALKVCKPYTQVTAGTRGWLTGSDDSTHRQVRSGREHRRSLHAQRVSAGNVSYHLVQTTAHHTHTSHSHL